MRYYYALDITHCELIIPYLSHVFKRVPAGLYADLLEIYIKEYGLEFNSGGSKNRDKLGRVATS
jgi:hypothetical protein